MFDHGASMGSGANPAVIAMLVSLDEEQLGRMAAAQVCRRSQASQAATLFASSYNVATVCYSLGAGGKEGEQMAAAAAAVLQLVRLAGFVQERAAELRNSDPRSADEHQALFARLQLATAACVQNDESGMARDDGKVAEIGRLGGEGPSIVELHVCAISIYLGGRAARKRGRPQGDRARSNSNPNPNHS